MTSVHDPLNIGDAKRALRQSLRERRALFVAALPASVRALAFRVLPRPVVDGLPAASIVALYYPVGDEAPTKGIATQLAERGHRLALPRAEAGTGKMDFAHWDLDDVLGPGPFRTLQPVPDAPVVTPDVIIAPLVGFDGALQRLGQGGGYYDRAFAAFPDALRIGLGWSAQYEAELPVEPTDMPLDMVVTEAALHERERR